MTHTFELVEVDEPATPTPAATNLPAGPNEMLRMAVAQNADIEKLTQLMDLQERWEAKEAKRAFLQAMTEFQHLCPVIKKNKRVYYETSKGATDYRYAPLGDITAQIKEALYQSGLSYRFVQEETVSTIKITCVVSHHDGHSEQTTLESVADNSGGKNSIQGIGSTVTYLSRYTLLSALGITTADTDVDGRIMSDTITTGQVESLKARVEMIGGKLEKFCQSIGVANLESMPANKYAQADTFLTQREVKVEKVNADS